MILALMSRVVPSRSVWNTARRRPRRLTPKSTKRSSLHEWRGSETVTESGSSNTVEASAKDTPCLARFCAAFSASHSNRMTYARAANDTGVQRRTLEGAQRPTRPSDCNAGLGGSAVIGEHRHLGHAGRLESGRPSYATA